MFRFDAHRDRIAHRAAIAAWEYVIEDYCGCDYAEDEESDEDNDENERAAHRRASTLVHGST